MRTLAKFLFTLMASTMLHAHVGSADVYYEGDAGPYHLFVTIRLPQVIPGVAEIEVRSSSADVQSIQVSSLRLSGLGSNLPPMPDVAQRSKDDPQFFVSNLWFMEFGALQVRVQADGQKGKAELSVPVASFARQSLPMNHWLGGVLSIFFVVLTVGIVVVAGAVVRESTVPAGERPQLSNRRRSWIVMGVTAVLVLMIVARGRASWNVEAATYKHNVDMLKPPQAEATLVDGTRLVVRPASPLMVPLLGQTETAREIKMKDVIPDHGHVMHLFLIRMPQMDRMWHLHPDLVKDEAFSERLPAMAAGEYQVFADIVDKDGFPWTMVGNVELPQINGAGAGGDDSGWKGSGLAEPDESRVAKLADGSRLVWERNDQPLKANVPASFRFKVEDKDGSPAHDVEPYMGMAAHAQVISFDHSVFAHIHPAGSVSMAALDMAQEKLMSQGVNGGMAMTMNMDQEQHATLPPNFSFPYGFPHAGDYRIFVQIKKAGKVQTAAFDVRVQ